VALLGNLGCHIAGLLQKNFEQLHSTAQESTENTTKMSAMDLDAPVSIAAQHRHQPTGATYVFFFYFFYFYAQVITKS
jgi:hypothetical protein